MNTCPDCACTVEAVSAGEPSSRCPYCGARIEGGTKINWVDVARVTNLAEAGFLSDELVGQGIDARIHQLEEFSASSHRWTACYLVRVPADAAYEAAAQIRRHLTDDTAETDDATGGFRLTSDVPPLAPAFWRPMVVVVLAGVASFVLGQQFSEQGVPRRPARDSLPAAVDALGRPLVTEPVPGQPRYRLQYDRRRRAWNLDCDRDNDGQYESRQSFHAAGAGM